MTFQELVNQRQSVRKYQEKPVEREKMETILEADGITKQMIEDQQKRLNLLQKLASTAPDKLTEAIKAEEALIDVDFFNLLTRPLPGPSL
ncbi:MAG: hypothetical protein EOM73_09295, partial [Bacteroidia bacterium]|nr:hypothetical protein [Bacteroidia bacterium]